MLVRIQPSGLILVPFPREKTMTKSERQQQAAAQAKAEREAMIRQAANERAMLTLQTSLEIIKTYGPSDAYRDQWSRDAQSVYLKALAIVNSMLPEVRVDSPPVEPIPVHPNPYGAGIPNEMVIAYHELLEYSRTVPTEIIDNRPAFRWNNCIVFIEENRFNIHHAAGNVGLVPGEAVRIGGTTNEL